MMKNEQTPQGKRIGAPLDLYVKDTDVAQLRRSLGCRTPHTDRDRQSDWQLRWELLHPNARLDTINRRVEVIHVKNH